MGGREADLFADSDVQRHGDLIDGKKIVGIEEIPKTALVIIAANVKYNIHVMLEEQAIEYMYLDPVFFASWNPQIDIGEILKENRREIDYVYELLSDEHSKKIFKNVLMHRLVHDIKLIWDVYEPNQYFANGIVKKAKG